MAKNSLNIRIAKAIAKAKHETQNVIKQLTLDMVVITLGKMGMTPEGLSQFRDEFEIVWHDYFSEANKEITYDPEMVYSKFDLDRSLQMYLKPEDFIPLKERYTFE